MNSKVPIAITFVTLVIAATMLIRGCKTYGTVGPKTYEYAQALYGACRRRDDPKMASRAKVFAALREKINKSVDSNDITGEEAGWLNEIMEHAESGDVTGATAQARLMMEEQVEGR